MKPFKPSAPFIWPEPRVIQGSHYYEEPVPFQTLAALAGSMFGIVYGLDETGVQWLDELIQSNESLQCKLIIAVYPACATKRPALKGLLKMQLSYSEERVSFRVMTTSCQFGATSNTLCFINPGSSQTYYTIGPTPNFGLIPAGESQVNFVFSGDAVLLESWRNWFDMAWAKSAPLNARTIKIPDLVPAEGTKEAAAMWKEYVEQCKQYLANRDDLEEPQEIVEVCKETGKVVIKLAEGETIKTPTEELDLPRLDPLAEIISKIYDQGSLVNFSKVGRIPPLDAPIKPEWFGVETLRHVGSITRETKYRISVLDEKTLRNIKNKKNAGRRVLNQLSFSLGDNQPWMPNKVKKLFEKELKRVNEEGLKEVSKAFNGKPDAFINAQKKRITKDANDMYRDFHPNEKLSDEVIESILDELKERMTKATTGNFIPQVSYNRVGFHYEKKSEWVTQWDQPMTLLIQIAEFPRKSITDPFFLRGLRLDKNELLQAMDVCGDHLVKASQERNVEEQAKKELEMLNTIKMSDADSRQKCEAFLALMAGKESDYLFPVSS